MKYNKVLHFPDPVDDKKIERKIDEQREETIEIEIDEYKEVNEDH